MQVRWTPYPWVCFSMCVGVMGTALASPLYPLYQSAWGLQPSHITQVFVAYMLGALASLLFLGRLTDRFGFLAVLRLGLLLMTLAMFASALAWNIPGFALCRVLIGVASGLITTSASVGMTRLNHRGDLQRAAATTSLTIAFGFGLGPVMGGIMGQWAPWPLHTAYLPSGLLGLLAVYALYRIQIDPALAGGQASNLAQPGLRLADVLPTITLPKRHYSYHFALGCMAAFSAFGMFSLFASLAPSFMAQMLPWHGPAVSGLSIGMILFLSALVQLIARPWPTKTVIVAGFALLALSNALLLLNLLASSTAVFALCVLATAAGHALCNLGGMSVVNKVSTPASRTGLLSTYLVVGYLGTILPILGVGWLSDILGLTQALVGFCLGLGLLAVTLAALCARARTLRTPKV
ncbi:MAG: MFS transporter [Acidovorax sp.]|nr:MFS transporter [Acidovorax sp.]